MGSELQTTVAPGPPAEPDQDQKFREALSNLLIQGKKPGEIARALHPDDKKAQKYMRSKIRRMVENDPKLAEDIGRKARAKLLMRLGPMVEGLIARAESGRPDAVKLAFEASGFHNPRVQHDHTGDISISLNLPRPAPVEGQVTEIQDADVVEEGPTG